jgi:hypothetical protein
VIVLDNAGIPSFFTAKHHALIYVWIVKELIELVGEEAAVPIIRKATKCYGEQRGRRMALRACLNGHELSMLNYLAYSEWKAGKDEMVMHIAERHPHLRVRIPVCPWYTVWQNQDLLHYGAYYCETIDRALVSGFNPDLSLDIITIKPSGSKECDMIFKDARMSLANMLKLIFRKHVSPGSKALMPWEYHTGHIYKTLKEEISGTFGEKGTQACDAALAIFSQKFGEVAAQIIQSHWDIDFNRLPG